LFKVIAVGSGTTVTLVNSACYDKQLLTLCLSVTIPTLGLIG